MSNFLHINEPIANMDSHLFRLKPALTTISCNLMGQRPSNLSGNRYFNLIPYFGGKYIQLKDTLPYIEEVATANNAHTYIECFGGGGKCILNLDTTHHQFKQKIYNEWDAGLCSLFKMVSEEKLAQQLIEKLRTVKYQEEIFKFCKEHRNDAVSDLEKAFMIFILCYMSISSGMKDFAKPRYDKSRIDRFYNSVERICEAPSHLENVTVINGDYKDLMLKYGTDSQIVKYLDPPYHPACRNKDCLKVYPNELSIDQHREMVEMLCESRSWVLSGYDPLEFGSTDYEPLVKFGAIKESIGMYSISPNFNDESYKREFIWYKP